MSGFRANGDNSGQRAGAAFPRNLRLLRHADFRRVYEHGQRHFSANLTVFYLRREAGAGLRVGFTVGRVLGGAVDRNRIKRRLREAVRLRRPDMQEAVDVVINPKRSALTADFAGLQQEVSKAFEVIRHQIKPRKPGP